MSVKSKAFVVLTASMVLLSGSQASWAADAKQSKGTPPKTESAQKEQAHKAKIKFESREYDFGTVEQGEKVTHIFQLSNIGTEPLTIDRVQTSCGCTAAVTSSKTILPKENGTIETTFNSSRFHGQIHKTITVYSNDPDEPVIRLTIRGKVVTDIVIIPREMFFGLVDYQKSTTRNILITQGGDTPLEIKKIESDLEFISTEILPGTKGNKKTYTVTVKLSEKAPVGRFEGKLKIHTNLPKHPVIEHKVMGVVRKAKPAAPVNSVPMDEADMPDWVEPLPGEKAPAAKKK